MSRPRLDVGLRPRLLAALLLTSAATLGVAALALLSPLEHRLRTSSENSVYAALASARNELHEIRQVDLRTDQPDPYELQIALGQLRHQAGGQVWVLNERLEVVSRGAPGGLDVPTYFPQVERALAGRRRVHTLSGNVFLAAEAVRIHRRRFALVVVKRLDFVTSSFGVVQSAFIEAAVAGFTIAILLAIGLATRLVRRLRRLRDAARRLEAGGLDTPLELDGGRDEIGELARALRTMQSRLAHQDAALRAFVATASHELRTPLASLDGLLELIEEDLAPEHLDIPDARERTARAKDQARRLANLASDLLDLSRLDAEVKLRNEPIELAELARAVVAEFDIRAADCGVALTVATPSRPCWVHADPGAVARIVRILLDNALRVAPRGSTIETAVAHAPAATGDGGSDGHGGRSAARGPDPDRRLDRAPAAQELANGPGAGLIVVRDEGPGVEEAEREHIFERFRRGSRTAGQGGFGLGLAIGRELAARMGGDLTLLDEPGDGAQASGASFALSLPAAPLHYLPLASAADGEQPAAAAR